MELPLGVIAIAVSTVILPKLSRDFAQGQHSITSNTELGGLGSPRIGAPVCCSLGRFW